MEQKNQIKEDVTTVLQAQENAQNDTPLPVITQTTDETQTPTILSTDQSNNNRQPIETLPEILPQTPEIFNTPTDDSTVPGFIPGFDPQQISTNLQPTLPINKPPVNQSNDDTPVDAKDNESLTTNLDLLEPQTLQTTTPNLSESETNNSTKKEIQKEEEEESVDQTLNLLSSTPINIPQRKEPEFVPFVDPKNTPAPTTTSNSSNKVDLRSSTQTGVSRHTPNTPAKEPEFVPFVDPKSTPIRSITSPNSNKVDSRSFTQPEVSRHTPPKDTSITLTPQYPSTQSDFPQGWKDLTQLQIFTPNENRENSDLYNYSKYAKQNTGGSYYPSVITNQSGSPRRFSSRPDSLGKNLFNPVKFEYQPPKGQAGCIIQVHFDAKKQAKVINQIKEYLKQIKPCCNVSMKDGCVFLLKFPSNTELATHKETGTFLKEADNELAPCIKFANTKERNLFMSMFGMAESNEHIKINEEQPNIVEIYPSFFVAQQNLHRLNNY